MTTHDCIDDLCSIIIGIEALTHHRISPRFVDEAGLTAGIERLQDQLSTVGASLLLTSPADAYAYDASWVAWSNSTLDIILHLPCAQTDQLLQVYQVRLLGRNDHNLVKQLDLFLTVSASPVAASGA